MGSTKCDAQKGMVSCGNLGGKSLGLGDAAWLHCPRHEQTVFMAALGDLWWREGLLPQMCDSPLSC